MEVEGLLVDGDEGVAQSVQVDHRGHVGHDPEDAADPMAPLELERVGQVGAVHRNPPELPGVVVAVDVGQMVHVHRVLGRELRVALQTEPRELQRAPRLGFQGRKDPLRGPADRAPPGEDHAGDFLRLEHAEPGVFRRRRTRRCDALAVDVVLEPVEGADEAAVAHPPAHARPEVRPEVRAIRTRDANAAPPVAPRDDVLAQKDLLDQPGLADRVETLHEVPALRKGRSRRWAFAPRWGRVRVGQDPEFLRASSLNCIVARTVSESRRRAGTALARGRGAGGGAGRGGVGMSGRTQVWTGPTPR